MNSHINVLKGIVFAAVSMVVAIFALPTPGYAGCTNNQRTVETNGSLCIDHRMCVCQSNSDFDCVGKPACHHEDNHTPPTTLIILNTDQKTGIHIPKKTLTGNDAPCIGSTSGCLD
jgi:hypothetical protein